MRVVVATPAVGVTGPDADTEPSVGVTFVKSTCGAVALATVLPLASLSAALTVTVEMPSATVRVALAEQPRLAGEPKTVTAADALSPADVATTVHGWLAEFVAVAANSPTVVIAPQPPSTVHVLGLDAVNWIVPPTGREAEGGEIVSADVGSGVVFAWK